MSRTDTYIIRNLSDLIEITLSAGVYVDYAFWTSCATI